MSLNISLNLPNAPTPLSEPIKLYVWLLILILPLSSFLLLRTTSDGKLYDLGGFPIATAWTFFSKRYDFMRRNFKLSGGLPFRFRVLQHRVIAVTGPIARKGFFNDAGLDLVEGYKILLGGAPMIEDVKVNVDMTGAKNLTDFLKRLAHLLRKERVTEYLPLFLEDVHNRMSEWGAKGMIDPFKQVNDITVRMSTCRELAKDRAGIEKMATLYWALEKSATAEALLLPWIPSPSKKAGDASTLELFSHLAKYCQDRRAAGATTSDPIDMLIQYGDSDEAIVQTIFAIVFASVANTGIIACWALLYLGHNPTWRQRAISDLQSLVSRYNEPSSSEPLYKKLSNIPLSDWEDNLPSIDLITRETIRFSGNGTFVRRNVVKDTEVQGVTIKKGDFLVYDAMDVHLNEDIYTDHEKFDPSRFEPGREEDKKVYFGFLGWGVGRHPCAGMKMAKLEIKIILAMVLLTYNYDVVDENGFKVDSLPKPNRNDNHHVRPLGKTVYMKYTPQS